MAGPVIEIEPPVRAKRAGGLSAVATFRPNERLGVSENVVFQSDGCTFPKLSEHLCYRTPDYTPGEVAVQTVGGATPTSGTFAISDGTGTTTALAFDAAIVAINAALVVAEIAAVATDGPLPADVTITFDEAGLQPALTLDVTLLVGGDYEVTVVEPGEDPEPIEPPDKTFTGISIDDAIGVPFPLYAGVKCVLGPDPDELERAVRVLDEGRDRELEAQLFAWAAGGIVAGGGVIAGVAAAVARVEQQLDDDYVGRGIVLMSRYDATLASKEGILRDTAEGAPLFTKLGTPVIASGRVTPGTIYGLGAVVVEHSTTKSFDVLDPTHNQHYALAEAVYVLAVDCEFRIKSAIA